MKITTQYLVATMMFGLMGGWFSLLFRWWFQRLTTLASLLLIVSVCAGGCVREQARPAVRPKPSATARKTNSRERDAVVRGNTFVLPFLGTIHGQVSAESVDVITEGAGKITLPFRVFKNGEGRFLRAEFMKPGARNYEDSVQDMEAGMKAQDQQIVALAKAAPQVSLETVVQKVAEAVEIEKVTRLTVTYVDYRLFDQPVEPIFIVHVFGVPMLGNSHYGPFNGQGGEYSLRMRFFVNAQGMLTRGDTCL